MLFGGPQTHYRVRELCGKLLLFNLTPDIIYWHKSTIDNVSCLIDIMQLLPHSIQPPAYNVQPHHFPSSQLQCIQMRVFPDVIGICTAGVDKQLKTVE